MLLPQTVALFLALANAATVPKPISLRPATLDRTSNGSSLQNNASTTIPHLPNELFFYHIPGTTLDLYIRDVGDRMPISNILTCLHTLSDRIVARIAAQGEAARSIPMSYRQGVVAVTFTPLRLSWVKAGIVIGTVETLVQHDNWTYATHIMVKDQHEGIVVGYVNIRYRAPDPRQIIGSESSVTPSSSTITHSNTNTNTTLSTPNYPSSPYPYVIPNSHISLIFAAYGPQLSASTVFTIFLDAQIYISTKVRVLGPFALVDALQPWKLGNVVMELVPGRRLRWWDLMIAIEGLVDFVGSFGAFAFGFEIRWEGFRELGRGELRVET